MYGTKAAVRRARCVVPLLLLCAGLAHSQGTSSLAVMEFNCSGVSGKDAAALTDAVFKEIARARTFTVLGRDQRDQVLREWGFRQGVSCGDTACLFEAGRYLRVNRIVGGTIGKTGGTWTVAIRLLDLRTGGIDMAVDRDLDGDTDALLAYLREIGRDISRTTAGRDGSGGPGPTAAMRGEEPGRERRRLRLEFNVSGGVRLARDLFTADQTVVAPGSVIQRYILSENRGGFCLEGGVTCSGLGRFAPICFADYSFDRSAIKSAPAAQYLRSRGLTVIGGLSYALDLSFFTLAAMAGAGHEWESLEQQNGYFGGLRIDNNAPAAAAGLCLDSPLFRGIWTTLRYKYLYTRCSPAVWTDQDIRYTFVPRRERHVVTFGLIIKP